MNGELLSALERIERQKGIEKEILFEAIESALVSAARKIIDDPEIDKEDITVQIDKQTGEIHVYSDEGELRSEKFGRIAAQTAKQVIMQKIREAERDVIYDKYSKKVGSIINGQVHRFDRGNIIVELDDAEALLPRSQQIPGERFRQGEDIRAYLYKVEKGTGGSDLILSRCEKNFVRRLFELEVPEIADGIVEIKGLAREPGDRTKIAVQSKDDKIDAVGACVGMKGSRVRDIVRELSGERIDVVRWNEDIREYVPAAVSPAEISKMIIDRENERITLKVPQDQLSILIGKKGRNIRLASKLVGWELKAESDAEDTEVMTASLEGLEQEVKTALIEAGFDTAEKICNVTAEKLAAVEGMEEQTVVNILEVAKKAYLDAQIEKERLKEEAAAEEASDKDLPEDAEVSEEDEADVAEEEDAVASEKDKKSIEDAEVSEEDEADVAEEEDAVASEKDKKPIEDAEVSEENEADEAEEDAEELSSEDDETKSSGGDDTTDEGASSKDLEKEK